MRYSERQHLPVWAAIVVVVGWGVLVVGIPLALTGFRTDTFGWIWVIVLYPGIMIPYLLANARRLIQIDDRFLRVGRREPIPLETIEGMGILTGRALRRARAILFWGRPSGKLALGSTAAAVVGAWGTAGGLATLAGHRSRYGIACPWWSRYGLLVHAPTDSNKRHDVWLIATRKPEQIRDALIKACTDRRHELGRTEQAELQPA